MSDMQIKVSFGALSSAAGDIATAASQVEQQLSDLKSKVAPVAAQWAGGSSEGYQQAQKKWDDSAADLRSVLAAIGTAVQQAVESYQQAEHQNTNRWQG
ncbi:WXG100 family type VII secretion target [Solihabitans fulvus]|uniref:ESAT-6-like protein n=1 Tax=Solihabitans fulvus TaxID=1892852 RepID=A0A5B2XMT6_9PSEU|nr:WXG100 family type VII secretion target [Solihabitans fulvus]KAA2264693.1 WXG100 family type VII secretion target [Solihabitans fulvus]